MEKSKERNYVVYMHTSPSGKRYIGITCQNPPEKRWMSGRGYKYNEYFSRAISKYSWQNFLHEILIENLTQQEAEQKEIELIAYYKSADRNFGYNLDLGGTGAGKVSEETKRKMSEAGKGKNVVPVIQYSRSGEFIKKYNSIVEAADENGLFYSAISACCRDVSKTAGDCIWRYENEPLTKEHIEWCNSNAQDEKKMPIKQYEMNGQFIKEYESAEYASRVCGFNAPSIRQCCKYNRRSSNGFIWQYSDVDLTEEYVQWCNSGLSDRLVPVTQYTLSGELVKEFDSMTLASEFTGISIQGISNCCNDINKTSGNFIWRYSSEELTKEHIEWCNAPPRESMSVLQYSKNGILVAKWDKADNAEVTLGIDAHCIRACCRKHYKTIAGYIWRYEGEPLTQEDIDWCNERSNPKLHKAVDQYTKSGEFITTYESRTEAELKTGADKSAIGRCCNDKQRTSMGYIWRHHGVELTEEHLTWCNSTGKEGMRTAIIQYSLNGIFVKLWNSSTTINRELGFDNSAIIRCCKGEQEQSYGFIWRYASDIADPTAPLFPTPTPTLSETA